MKQLKAMIFEQMNKLQIENTENNKELYTLVFGIFKENAKTKQINPCVWLYLNNDYNAFSYILEDIISQVITEFYTDKETAFKNVFKYVYHQYYKTQTRNRPIEHYENEITTTIDTDTVQEQFNYYNIKLNTKEQQDYYKHILLRSINNSKKRGGVFKDKKQRQKTINQLRRLQIIEA